ncbi:MAG: hypothetical protein ACI8PB_002771 [Desulforhopalus sp.]|jgi:hypothetical protein
MIESTGVAGLIYQEQVARENQILRDQTARQEPEEESSRQGSADVTSFSSEGLELARTAVTATQAAPEADLEQKPQEEQVVPVSQTNGSSPARYLDIQA